MDDDWEEMEALMFGDTIINKTISPIFNDYTATPIIYKDFDDDEFVVRDTCYELQDAAIKTSPHFPLSISNLHSHLQSTHQERSSSPEDTCSDTTDTDSKDSLLSSCIDTLFPFAKDDISSEPKALYHVDYLSHEWQNSDDYWLSWKTLRQCTTDEDNTRQNNTEFLQARLENAMWRTWKKQHSQLTTMAPEKIAWTKDSDLTWLYGPLYRKSMQAGSRPFLALARSTTVDTADPLPLARNAISPTLPPPSSESAAPLPPRSILKRRTTREIILGLSAQSTPCGLKKSVSM